MFTIYRAALRLLPMAMLAGGHLAAQALGGGLAYVSNQQGGVSVINLDTMTVSATIDVAAHGPRGIALSDDGARLVTANMGDGNVSIIDTATGRIERQVAIGRNPEFVRVHGKIAFVTYEPGGGAPVAGAPPAKKDDDDELPGHIAVIDLASGRILRDITGKPQTEGLEFSADGSQLIITNESDNSLSVVDVATGNLLRTVSVADHGNRPRGIKRSPDGRTYVVTMELSGTLLVLDEHLGFLRQISTARTPYGVAFDRSGGRVFVATNKDRQLQVFDTATWTRIKDVPTADRCWHFSFTPDDRQILLACGKSNEVLVIDAQSLEVTRHIVGLSMPWGIVTKPRALGSLD